MTTTETSATGLAPTAISGQAEREFRRTRHRLTSVVYTPNDGNQVVPRSQGMDGAGWEAGYSYRVPGCGATQRWISSCSTSTAAMDQAPVLDENEEPVLDENNEPVLEYVLPREKDRDKGGPAWRWLTSEPIPQVAYACAELKMARSQDQKTQLDQAAARQLDMDLDRDLEWQFWKYGAGAPVNAPIEQVINPDDPLTPLQLADLISGYLQCSSEQLVVHTTGTLASLWGRYGWAIRGAGRNTLETMVGGHLITAGCYPAWCSPAGLPDLTAEQYAAGLAWVAVTTRPHVRIGGFWDGQTDPITFDAELGINKYYARAERTIAVDADDCNRMLFLAQYCEPNEAPIPETP